MKTLKQWAHELPLQFREEVGQIIEPTKHTQPFQNIVEFLDYVIYHYENSAIGQVKTSANWRSLRNQYAMGYATAFHVAFWVEKDVSSGDTVDAFDMHHAIDIVLARTGLPINQILYAHNKESAYSLGMAAK